MASSPHNHPRLRQEIAALFILFLAAFLLLCLVSYSRGLLGEEALLQASTENWCGSAGFFISHHLFSFLGLTAFLPVFVLVFLSGATIICTLSSSE